MTKIIPLKKAALRLSSHKENGETIVLTGGCFDILHFGHIKFLQEAKKKGDVLVVLLESDRKVKKLKGKNRPIFNQKERAFVLSAVRFIDYLILLPFLATDKDYDDIIFTIKPNVIAVAQNDPLIQKKQIQAQKNNISLKVIPFIKTYSSSKLAKILKIE